MDFLTELFNEIIFLIELLFSGEYGLTLSGSPFILAIILIVTIIKNRKQSFEYILVRTSYVLYMSMVIFYVFLPLPVNRLGVEDAQIMNGQPIFDRHYFLSIIPLYGVIFTNMIVSFIQNIILFIPYGVYVNVFNDNMSFKQTMIKALKFTMLIEITQLVVSLLLRFNYRSFDFNDIIANVLGGMIGYLLYQYIICPIYKMITRKNRFYVEKTVV